jgi:hypothetical protein
MDRQLAKVLAVVAAVGIGSLLLVRGSQESSPITASSASDTVFHASDPVLLGSTGRPQFVEFFHHA